MKKIGLKTPPSGTAETMEEAMQIADEIGNFPLIIRPAFTLGGSGGGIAYNVEEFTQIVESGLQASVTTQARPQDPHLQDYTCRSRGACDANPMQCTVEDVCNVNTGRCLGRLPTRAVYSSLSQSCPGSLGPAM